MQYSIIIPVHNEQANVRPLYERLVKVMDEVGGSYEIIFADDGSTDETGTALRSLPKAMVVTLTSNVGQSAALAAVWPRAQADTVITLDGDLENQPEDIPLLLDKFKQGYDLVTGWRPGRWLDQPWRRRWPSVLANKLLSWLSGVSIHDHGCGLRVWRLAAIIKIKLPRHWHRLLPAIFVLHGLKVAEVAVNFTPRRRGRSKYGWSRLWQVAGDIIDLTWRYKFKPRLGL